MGYGPPAVAIASEKYQFSQPITFLVEVGPLKPLPIHAEILIGLILCE